MIGSKTLTGTQTENADQDCSSDDVESLHEDICPTDSDQIHAHQSVSSLTVSSPLTLVNLILVQIILRLIQ
jgi:hypothetical protein